MLRVEKAEQKLQELQSKNNAAAQKSAIDLNSLKEKFADLEAQRAKMFKDGARSGQKEYDKLLVQLEKLDTKIQTLTAKSKVDASARASAEERVQREIKKTQERYDEMSAKANSVRAKLGKVFSGVGGFIAGGLSVAAFKSAIDNLDAIGKRARDIGVTASQLQELQHQAKLAGIETGALDVSMKAFNRNVSLAAMGTGEARNALDSMGISLKKANGETKTQSELLKETAAYFAQNAGDAENAGRAARLFGESGAELLRVFEQGEDVVNKVFNAKGIDEAAAAAERFNDTIENVQNTAMKAAIRIVDGWGKIAGAISFPLDEAVRYEKEMYNLTDKQAQRVGQLRKQLTDLEQWGLQGTKQYDSLYVKLNAARVEGIKSSKEERALEKAKAEQALRRLEFERNLADDEKKRLHNEIAAQKAAEEEYKLMERVVAAEEKISKLTEGELSDSNRIVALRNELASLEDAMSSGTLQKQAEATEKYADKLRELVSLEKKLKSEEAAQKKEATEADKRIASARADFELKTKISILEAQGKTREAEAIKFAQARNQLMEKYGYSLEQATRVQKTLNDLQNAKEGKGDAKYSDEAVKRAQKVLERGEGGSVGKKTLEDARAIVEGRTPEGGFQTAMFEKYAPQENKSKKSLKNINIDAKATRDNLDKKGKEAENKDTQALIALEKQMTDLNKVVDDIKNFVGKIAIKKESAA